MRARHLAEFIGTWQLEKEIRQADGAQAWFEGHASWDETGAYHEAGQLRLGDGTQIRAERRYVWKAPLRVCFDDGRFFHDVPPEGGLAHHHCAPDDYQVRYDFSAWPHWRAIWRVQGPRKDYKMVCRYGPIRQ